MPRRGRKPICNSNKEAEVSSFKQSVKDSNGLLVLFGNRVVKKYRCEYLETLRRKFGEEHYLIHLEDPTVNEMTKYTEDYIVKNEKRNQAVLKYREKEKIMQKNVTDTYSKLVQENKELEEKEKSMENEFFELIGQLGKMGILPSELPIEISDLYYQSINDNTQ